MNFLRLILEKLIGFLSIFFLGKQHERAEQAERAAKAARKEAQRHANTPTTPGDAASRLRERAKRKTRNPS